MKTKNRFDPMFKGRMVQVAEDIATYINLACIQADVPKRKQKLYRLLLWEDIAVDVARAAIAELNREVYEKVTKK